MRVPSVPSPVVGLAKVPQRAYLDLSGATAWDISPVGRRGNLDLMQYALIFFDVQLILAQMPPTPPPHRADARAPTPGRHLHPFLPEPGLCLSGMGRMGQSPCQWPSQWRALAAAAVCRLSRLFPRDPGHALSW